MPQYSPHHASWKMDGGAQVMDLATAVKDGILGGGVGITAAIDDDPATEKLDLKAMIEELDSSGGDEDIPSVFICPISLEAMTDPVTLCTGQTYERSNILRWLSMGHLSCPTTMQELWDDAVTPNATLHQLIHAWFSQRYLLARKRSDDVHGRAVDLLETLRRAKGQARRVQALRDLQEVVSAAAAAKAVADSGGVALVSSLLGPFTSHAIGSEAVGVLVHLPLDREAKATLMQPAKVSLVIDILNEGAAETRINCGRLIEVLMEDADFRSDVAKSLSLLVGLLRMAKDKRYPTGTTAALRLLKTLCSEQLQVRTSVISVGAVGQLVELLPDLNPDCTEHALQILDLLSAAEEGKAALKDCQQAIPNLVRVLMRVSEACTRHAMSVLWALCELAPEECALVAVEAGLAARLLLVIQSGCNPAMKQRAAELLKLCSMNYSGTRFISKCKLTRTIQ